MGGRGRRFISSMASTGLFGAKWVIAVDYLGLPVGARVVGARRQEVAAAQDLLDGLMPHVPRVATVLGDRGFRGLEGPLLRKHGVKVEFKRRQWLKGGFEPIRPLWRVEDAFAENGRWRRLARSFEGTPASATAPLQVACVGWLLTFI